MERYFPWGKEGDYKDLSLSLSSLDDDGCAVASRHVTTRTTPRAAFFLLPLFSLSLSLFVFCFFHSPLHFCISSFGRLINRAHRFCREIRFCVLLKIIASLLLLLLLLLFKTTPELLLPFLRVLLLLPFLLLLHLRLELVVIAGVDLAIRREHLKNASVFRCLLLGRR